MCLSPELGIDGPNHGAASYCCPYHLFLSSRLISKLLS